MKIKKWTLEIDMKIKNWDTEIIMKIALKWNSLFYNAVINPKDADEITSSVDTDQIVLVGLEVMTIILQKSLYQIRLKKQSDQGLHWLTYCQHFLDILSGPGCLKLTTSLVNVLLKFQMLISQICQYFFMKKCEKL